MVTRITSVGVTTAVAALLALTPMAAAAPQQAPAPLTGEILYQAVHPDPQASAQCTSDSDNNSTYTFDVDDGFAIGPYPGTFDEHVSVTIGPRTLGRQPFPPFDLPGEDDPPIPGAIDIGLLFFDQGPLVRVQSTFQILTLDGRRVEGTKTLSGVAPGLPNSGACTDFADFGSALVSGYYKDIRAYDLEYEARIHTSAGTFVDEGNAVLTAREGSGSDPNGNFFFRFDDFLETFQSTLGVPVELKPGLGCGDLNHVHERAEECKNQS